MPEENTGTIMIYEQKSICACQDSSKSMSEESRRGHIMIIIILDQLVDVVLVDVFEDVEADVR